jgi:hypothetical protein
MELRCACLYFLRPKKRLAAQRVRLVPIVAHDGHTADAILRQRSHVDACRGPGGYCVIAIGLILTAVRAQSLSSGSVQTGLRYLHRAHS